MTNLAGCASSPKDEFAGRNAEKLYAEAKADADAGSYDRAIKALERVEGLGAGTLLAQQSQLDLAYLYWKTNERAQALSTIERFIKYNPSSPALDYALYLRGVIEAAAKSAARGMASSVGRGLGNQILRGVLGSILGGRR